MVRILDDWNGEERAVSPVIGVILMVAITVILAAVIGTFVLDLGQNVQNTGPSASIGFSDAETDYDPTDSATSQDFVVLEHQSGEALDGDAIRIVVRNATSNAVVAEYDAGTTSSGGGTSSATFELNDGSLTQSSTVNVGDQIVVKITPAGSNPEQDGRDYAITMVSTETDNRIGTGTVEVQ